jgi:DNA-binding SARP family transcriptional activator/pimeloyl-ACP methyl ester carboxylesterase
MAARTRPDARDLPALELQLLGVPSVLARGQEVPLSLKRGFALLAILAFHPGPVPREHLATLLWPEAGPAQGRTRLRRLAYTLEEAAACEFLAADGDALGLLPGAVETDALRFARLARRVVAAESLSDTTLAEARHWLARARRPLLEGLSFGSDAFDDWLKMASLEHEHLLARLLERVIDALARRGRFADALELVEQLLALDPWREPGYVLLMQLHAMQGHGAGVEAAYARCADVLRAEFGIRPGPQTEAAYARMVEDLRRLMSHRVERPAVRFAESAAGALAYTVLGSGGRTLVVSPGFVCHIELALEHPPLRDFVQALAQRFRVILFDRRGIGLSERLRAQSTPAALAQDVSAILDDAGVRDAWLFGSSEGGLGAMRLAIDRPERVSGLCLFGSLARGSAAPDYPWALPAAAYDVWLARLVAAWGGPLGLETFAPAAQDDPALRAWWARLVRHAVSPGGLETILGGLRDADLRADLARIRAPTLVMHRRGDRAVRFDAGRHLAGAIPGATWHPLEGIDHFWWCGDSGAVLEAILDFTGA